MAAEVVITSVKINLASDLTNYQDFPLMSDLQTLDEQMGEARIYANGRMRIVTKPGKPRSFQLSLPACTRAQINWLKLYVGQGVLVRDDRENKVWCVYFKMPVVEFSTDTDRGDITLALTEYTHIEAV